MTDTPVITALTSITQLMRGSDEEPVITEEGRFITLQTQEALETLLAASLLIRGGDLR